MSEWDEINKIKRQLTKRKPESIRKQAHIADATGTLASVTAQFNALLAALEAAGILESS